MKKGFIYLLLFSGIVSLFSCEDTDYQIYDKIFLLDTLFLMSSTALIR